MAFLYQGSAFQSDWDVDNTDEAHPTTGYLVGGVDSGKYYTTCAEAAACPPDYAKQCEYFPNTYLYAGSTISTNFFTICVYVGP